MSAELLVGLSGLVRREPFSRPPFVFPDGVTCLPVLIDIATGRSRFLPTSVPSTLPSGPSSLQRLSCLDKPQRAVSHQRGALGDGAEACQCTNTGRSSGYGCKPASSRLGDAKRDRDDFIASPT